MTATQDLTSFVDRKVVLVYNSGDETKEIEGTVQQASAVGVIIKPKGRAGIELIEAGQIERIEAAPEKEKTLPQKNLKNVLYGAARQHLLDRHSFTLTQVNSMTEEAALEVHDAIDHADLGHSHGEVTKNEVTGEAAPESAGE